MIQSVYEVSDSQGNDHVIHKYAASEPHKQNMLITETRNKAESKWKRKLSQQYCPSFHKGVADRTSVWMECLEELTLQTPSVWDLLYSLGFAHHLQNEIYFYPKDLKSFEPFFFPCRTVSQWRTSILLLKTTMLFRQIETVQWIKTWKHHFRFLLSSLNWTSVLMRYIMWC